MYFLLLFTSRLSSIIMVSGTMSLDKLCYFSPRLMFIIELGKSEVYLFKSLEYGKVKVLKYLSGNHIRDCYYLFIPILVSYKTGFGIGILN